MKRWNGFFQNSNDWLGIFSSEKFLFKPDAQALKQLAYTKKIEVVQKDRRNKLAKVVTELQGEQKRSQRKLVDMEEINCLTETMDDYLEKILRKKRNRKNQKFISNRKKLNREQTISLQVITKVHTAVNSRIQAAV